MNIHQRALSLLLSLTLVLGIFGVDTVGAYAAQDSGIKNSGLGAMRLGANGARELSLDDGIIIITDSGYSVGGGSITDYSGSYLITQNGNDEVHHTITVQSGTQDIILQNVHAKPAGGAAFEVEGGAEADITLEGSNSLDTSGSTSSRAGLAVNDGGTVRISGSGSLTAAGGYNSAGIGGNNCQSCGTVEISGGTVTATGGSGGAGIGGGYGGSGGTITITGGTITATGGFEGAGIGGGSGGYFSGTITVSGGTITATGGSDGAGIGGGYDGSGGTTTVSGGTVTATGGGYGAGIGGSVGGSGGTVTISGAETQVTAKGGDGKDIGSGNGGTDGGSLVVSDGATVAMLNSNPLHNTNAKNPDTHSAPPKYVDCFIISGNTEKKYDRNGTGTSVTMLITTLTAQPATNGAVALTANAMNGSTPVTDGTFTFAYSDAKDSGTITDNVTIQSDGTASCTWTPPTDGLTVITAKYKALGFDALKAVFYYDPDAIDLSATGSDGFGYTYGSNTFTINQNGAYVFTGSTIGGAANKIAVRAGVSADITLCDASIDVHGTDNACAFSIAAGAKVNLTLEGQNTLKSGDFCAGLQVPGDASAPTDTTKNASLTVTDASTGSLNATGGSGGAGIGGGYTRSGGTITVSGGTVKATGGSDGAGIGGGYQGSGGTITITGGTVTATGGSGGAGIGGGYQGSGGTITITGGTVTAKGTGAGCEDIGGNATTNYFNGGSIDADAGKVTAPPTLTSGTAVYKTTMQLENISTETLVSCTANGSTFKSYTDANGKLYLWLPSGSPKAVVSNAGNTGTYGGTVTDGGTNILSLLSTACDITGVTVPSGAVINGTDISAQVGNGITSTTVDMTVSPNATWKLYSDQSCQTECSDKMMTLNEGVNTAYIKVTAQDGKTEKIYTLAITRAGSPDANLAGLSVKANGGDVPLSPAFGANILNYTANVGSGVSEITVTPAVREPSAVFTVNGKAPAVGQTDVNITLNGAGQTTAISVKVTAQDGATAKIYTLNISREAASTPSNSSDGSSHGSTAPSLPASVTDTPTNTTVDLSGATFPVGVTGVSLAVTPETSTGAPKGVTGGTADPQGTAVDNLVLSDAALNIIGTPLLYNIQLLDQSGNPVSFTGSVTVRLSLPTEIHGTPHIFRYEESTGTFTDLGATVENGFLVFKTTHFSYYVIAGTGDSVTLDTKSYQMPVGGKYQIGVKLTGGKAATVKFHSTNDKIAAVAKLKNGNYQVNGKGTGTAWIMFDVYDNKNHLLTHASVRVDVKTGIRPRGDSTRQIGVF